MSEIRELRESNRRLREANDTLFRALAEEQANGRAVDESLAVKLAKLYQEVEYHRRGKERALRKLHAVRAALEEDL